MKKSIKFISIMLMLSMLLFAVPIAHAAEADQQPNIKDALIQKVLHGREENLLVYKELYTHKDQDGNNDWTLIFARTTFYDILEAGFAYDFGNVHYEQPGMSDDPLQICYTIYDHKTNEFCDFLKAWNPEWYPELAGTIRNYEGLHEVFGDVYYSVIKEEFVNTYMSGNEDSVKEFKELYYHKTEKTAPLCDWALVYCETNVEQPGISANIFGDRVLYRTSAYVPFTYGYGVYNYRTKSFVDLVEAWDDDKYEGLHEAFEARNAGTLLGDANKDNQLTIGDATKIQRYLARMIDDNAVGTQSAANGKTETEYICDFNKDGTVNISDVTAIQKKLAKY